MKESGKCPQCGASEIYTDANMPSRGDRCSIPIDLWTGFYVHTYVCINCGYFEEYMIDKDLQNEKKMNKIRETWKKISE